MTPSQSHTAQHESCSGADDAVAGALDGRQASASQTFPLDEQSVAVTFSLFSGVETDCRLVHVILSGGGHSETCQIHPDSAPCGRQPERKGAGFERSMVDAESVPR